MELTKEEKEVIVKALQFYLNNPYIQLEYDDLRKISDLKERIRFETK